MMLEQSTNDFKSLIQRVNLLKVYETAEEGHKYVTMTPTVSLHTSFVSLLTTFILVIHVFSG